MPPHSLGTVVIVAALLLAAWSLVPAVRDRQIDASHWAGLAIVQVLVVAEIVAAIVHLARGAHPHEYVTFIAYLVALVLMLPLGMVLARLEPTRWGAVIVTVAALVVPVLIVRVNQLWTGVG